MVSFILVDYVKSKIFIEDFIVLKGQMIFVLK